MHRHHRDSWAVRPWGIFVPAAAGALTAFLAVLLCAFLALHFLSDLRHASMLTSAACSAGSFTGAYIGGKYRRRRGIAEGSFCGLLIYILLSAAGMIFTGSPAGMKKLLLLTVSGAAGGVSGVNSKRPPKLMD